MRKLPIIYLIILALFGVVFFTQKSDPISITYINIVSADCDEETGEGCNEPEVSEDDEDEFEKAAREEEEQRAREEAANQDCEEDCPDEGESCSYEDDTPECDWDSNEVCEIQVNCEGDRKRGSCSKQEGLCGYDGGGDNGSVPSEPGETPTEPGIVCSDEGLTFCQSGNKVKKVNGVPKSGGECNYQFSIEEENASECFKQDPNDPNNIIYDDGKVVSEPVQTGGAPGTEDCNLGWKKQDPQCDFQSKEVFDLYTNLCTGEQEKTNFEVIPGVCGSGLSGARPLDQQELIDAKCQETSEVVHYCDGSVCIEKKLSWGTSSCRYPSG